MRKRLITRLDIADVFESFACDGSAVFLDSTDSLDGVNALASRYSAILVNPFGRVVFGDSGLKYERSDSCPGVPDEVHRQVEVIINDAVMDRDVLVVLSRILETFRRPERKGSLPTENGCFAGYIAYDYLEFIEKMPDTQQMPMTYPILCLGMFDHSIIYDHHQNEFWVCGSEIAGLSLAMFEARFIEVEQIIRYWERQEDLGDDDRLTGDEKNKMGASEVYLSRAGGNSKTFCCSRAVSPFSEKRYAEMVEKAREFIRDGDIYQVNLSQCFHGRYQGNPYRFYRSLRSASPASFLAFARFPEVTLASSSPERFFRISEGKVETRPIKGTRPRCKDSKANEDNRLELLRSEKDRAELMMIVDLMRNDLGKICRFGQVKVEKLFELETYRNVFHLVSTIVGEMNLGVDAFDVVRALFPGGSITGAPKIRAMEIIRSLEPHRRGIYTGSIGYIGFDGTADLNIAIRTVVFENNQYRYCVGGGIVWDSIPEEEYLETLHKGRAIRESLEIFECDSFSNFDKAASHDSATFNFFSNGRDAIVETFGVSSKGKVSRLRAHVERLRNSAVCLGFGWPFDDEKVVDLIVDELRNTNYHGRVLRMLYFGISGQDCNHKVESPLSPFFRFESRDRYQPISAGGLSLTVHSIKRNPQAILTYHKTTDYLENRLALVAANERGFDDALFLNPEGEIAETTRHNIFVKIGNTLYTPRIETGILPGVTRAWLIHWAQDCGMDVHVIALKQDIFKYADQVFLTNAVIGAMPVKSIHEGDELIYQSTMTDAWISEVNAAFEAKKY